MTEHRETAGERQEHIAGMRRTLAACVSSRQRQALRQAIRLAMQTDRKARP